VIRSHAVSNEAREPLAGHRSLLPDRPTMPRVSFPRRRMKGMKRKEPTLQGAIAEPARTPAGFIHKYISVLLFVKCDK
jgi:hypothetical protein